MTHGRYRRIGTVRANRLTAPLEWTTSQGDALRGEAGDWVVRSTSAGRRTIAAEVFPRLYEWVTADTYRAIGEVDARQTQHEERVATLEGPVGAGAGDWVLTDDGGNSWPVPDSVFQATYEEIA
jgi:hypothetical protein